MDSMSRLLMSLMLLYKKVEVLENEVWGLIPTPVQITRQSNTTLHYCSHHFQALNIK